MQASESAKRLLKNWEGFRGQVYPDILGKSTIGYGHLVGISELKKFSKGITREEADRLFEVDLQRYVAAVNKFVNVKLRQNQFDALVSFVYNVGVGNFSRSTLLKALNSGKFSEVPTQLNRWCRGDHGEIIKGLQNRRAAEIKLWNTP